MSRRGLAHAGRDVLAVAIDCAEHADGANGISESFGRDGGVGERGGVFERDTFRYR